MIISLSLVNIIKYVIVRLENLLDDNFFIR